MSREAPGWPGMGPRWTSSAKSGVGTAPGNRSYVWFTVSHGIINEIYYPGIDRACTRDMGMIVTDGASFFSEEKRHTKSVTAYLAEGVPGFSIVDTCNQGRYTIYKDIVTDPERNSVLQRTRFVPGQGGAETYHLYVLLAPHIGNRGYGNNAVVGDYKGVPMLFAYREGTALALACSAGFVRRSVGYVGISDGWQDLSQHRRMAWEYTTAYDGNVAMTGELDLEHGGESVIAIGFGATTAEAGNSAVASLLKGFDACKAEYTQGWRSYQEGLIDLHRPGQEKTVNVYRASTAVLKTHETKDVPGAVIASLSIPWGQAMGDDDIGGYHLLWPRDLVETAGGFLAAGDERSAREILFYLMTTQEKDGHWPQNMWRDGTPFWGGIQLDEAAFPVLLAGMLRREGALGAIAPWSMIEKAAGFILRNGPVTQQDRWEEDPGYSPFTLAASIAALIVAAEFADQEGEHVKATYMRETADLWNASIERWIYVKDTALARQLGIDGYYVRIAPPETSKAGSPLMGFVPIKNRPYGDDLAPADNIISTDFLALVRFGLRSAADPCVLNTLQAVDARLRTETPPGPSWHRYNDDGYGEHEDGGAYDGTGTGRLWPLLTGERGHYELQRGNGKQAEKMLLAMERFSNESGLISEQVWDTDDIPGRELFFGRPSGSAMPLVWAHAEYIKLLRSLRDGKVFDRVPGTYERYVIKKTGSHLSSWKFNHKCRDIRKGGTLRIETTAPALVHWSADGWHTEHDTRSRDTGMGMYVSDIGTADMAAGTSILFTFYWPAQGRWEGLDYSVLVREGTA